MTETFSNSEIILSSKNSNCFILKPNKKKNFTTLYPYNEKFNKTSYIRQLNDNNNKNLFKFLF